MFATQSCLLFIKYRILILGSAFEWPDVFIRFEIFMFRPSAVRMILQISKFVIVWIRWPVARSNKTDSFKIKFSNFLILGNNFPNNLG